MSMSIYESLMGSQLFKITQEAPVVSLYSLCAQGACAEVGKITAVILQHICDLSWVCLGWGLEISLHPFQLGHRLLLMPNFLPKHNYLLITYCNLSWVAEAEKRTIMNINVCIYT